MFAKWMKKIMYTSIKYCCIRGTKDWLTVFWFYFDGGMALVDWDLSCTNNSFSVQQRCVGYMQRHSNTWVIGDFGKVKISKKCIVSGIHVISFLDWMSLLEPCSSYDNNYGVLCCNHDYLSFWLRFHFYSWFQGGNIGFARKNVYLHLGIRGEIDTSAKKLNWHDWNVKFLDCCHNCCKACGWTSNQEMTCVPLTLYYC